MNLKDLKAVTEIFNESGVAVLEISEGETKIRLEKSAPQAVAVMPNPAAVPAVLPTVPAAAAPAPAVNGKTITSPMVGVFYASPSPDSPAFVAPGSQVKRGDVLCIIEAMKLMNEITAEADGEIAEVCAQNGQVVEFSQVLFRLK